MEHERALHLLSLAKKGGNIQLGEENTGAAELVAAAEAELSK